MAKLLVTALLPWALKIIEYFLDKSVKKAELKQKFLNFVHAMANDSGQSAKLRKSYQTQLKRLKQKQ